MTIKSRNGNNESGLDLVFKYGWDHEVWSSHPCMRGDKNWNGFIPANEAQDFAYRALQGWVKSENPHWFPEGFVSGIAMLLGAPGVGKSYLAAAFYDRIHSLICEESHPAVWIDAQSLMNWLPLAGDYWNYKDDDYWDGKPSPFGRMILTSWLFLDDLRKPRTLAEKQLIVDLFDARSQPEITILNGCGVITSNLSAEQLREAYGDRTFDRMNAGALWLPMNGKSLRRPQPIKVKREAEVKL